MSYGNGGIHIVAIINPGLYGIAFPGSPGYSLVGLFGIIPHHLNTTPDIHIKDLSLILEQWRSHNSIIKKLISSAVKVEFKQECVVDGVTFGKLLIFGSTNEIVDLKDYLIQTTIGVASSNPYKDALIIKTNSWKPSDFDSSLLSSLDNSFASASIKEKRNLRTRSTCLKKPQPLPATKSFQEISKPKQEILSPQDVSIVRAILKQQTVPAEFVHRYSSVLPPDSVPTSSSVPRFNAPCKPIIKKDKIIEDSEIDKFITRGEIDEPDNYLRLKDKWVEDLAFKHAGIVRKKLPPIKSEMPSSMLSSSTSLNSSPNSVSQGKLLALARGQTLTTHKRDQEKLSNSSEAVSSLVGIGRGHYLKSPLAGPQRVGGRGHLLRILQKQANTNPAPAPQPGALRKVFSLDVFGGALRTTATENDVLSDNVESASAILSNEGEGISLDKSSSISSEVCESESSAAGHSNDISVSDVETLDSSTSNLNNEQSNPFNLPEITSDCPVDEYIERILAFEGLIHGNNPLPPVNYFTDANMNSLIIESLKSFKVKDLQRSQSYAIPNIMKRRNVTIISPPKSGKTLAAVIPLVSLLCEHEFYFSLKVGCGPRAVYITSCSQGVNAVSEAIKKISPHFNVVNTYGGGNELEKMDNLVNGCDILVSTPRCWLRLLSYKWVTSVNRLCHLYIDDMDTVINLYKPELMEIFKILDSLISQRTDIGPAPQIVMLGETWNPTLCDIVMSRVREPMLCCTSFLEAAFYTHIKPTVHVVSPLNKVEKLYELLKNKDNVPSIIICNNSEEVCFLRNLLFTKRTNVLVAHGHMIFTMRRDTHVNWQNSLKSKPPLLITCDDALVDLGINNAQWLLHYSIPDSKTSFDYRFSTIKSNFIDRMSNPKAAVSPNCCIDILVDHTVEHQLPGIVSFMTRFKASFPEEVTTAVHKINRKREVNKNSEVGLCENLLQYGHCYKQVKCKQQHILNYDRDKPQDIPLSGYLKVKILKVHSPVHFSVRLIAHTEDPKTSPESWTTLPSTYVKVAMHINRYYSDRNNRRMHGSLEVGDLAGVEIDMDTNYRRVKILQITSRDQQHNPSKVRVHFIDEGTIAILKVTKLLYLPTELCAYSQTSVDIYLTELLPIDLDRYWSTASTSLVRKKIASLSDNYIIVAKISFILRYSIFAESLKALEALEISKCNVVQLSLRNYLLEKNIAVRNPDHLLPLVQLCQEANIPICGSLPSKNAKLKDPKKIGVCLKKVNKSGSSNSIMWAHLPKDEISTVFLSNAENPSLFYVSHTKFSSLLARLEKDISKYMENRKEIGISEISVNIICIAKYEDKWNRAMLLEESSQSISGNDEATYPVQFLDYGDIAYLPITDIAHCPDKFISALPFQAIKCELVGLNPLNDKWSEEIGDILYEMTQTTDSDDSRIFKYLSLVVAGVVDEGHVTKSGKHYKVILIDSSSGSDVILNKEMVSLGYANWNPQEKSLLDDMDINNFHPKVSNTEDEALSDGTFDEFKDNSSKVDNKSTKDVESSVVTENNPDNSIEMSDNQLVKMLEDMDIHIPLNEDSPLKFLAHLQKSVLLKAGKKCDNSFTENTKKLPKTHQSSTGLDSENDADISELEDSQNSTVNLSKLHFKSGFFTPKAGWLQTDSFIYIRIMIPGTETYSLVWSSRHFDFITTYDGKRYRLYVELFGSVSPDKFYHFARGQYVELKMLKILTDLKWPRLLYDEQEKPIWLQILDEPDMKEDDYLTTQVNLGELSLQHFKKERSRCDGDLWHYDKEDHESDGSDVYVEEDNLDPYNPLA